MLAALALLVVSSAPAERADVYVSPNGNDAWSGRLPTANRKKTDGPFATLERARRAVRDLRSAKPDLAGPVVVRLRGGTYPLAKTLELGPRDGGTEGAPVVYAAYGAERPVLSGGVRLKGLRVSEGRWTLSLPEVARGEWNFSQLFVNGERRLRPRLPRTGYFTIEEQLPPSGRFQTKGDDRFRYREGDLAPRYHNMTDVEALVLNIWSMSRMRLREVDPATRTVAFTGATGYTDGWASMAKGHRYLLENVREALAEPGQWYLDRKSGLLTVIPKAGETAAKAVVVAPRLEKLLTVRGCRHLRFEGIGLAHTNTTLPAQGRLYPQAEADLSGAVSLESAEHVAFDRCDVALTGGWAIEVGDRCRYVTVERCRLTDLGAGGVKVGTQRYEPNEALATGHVTVRDCLIAGGGRVHPAAIGVWVGHSAHNAIENNEIADLYYTGVSVGWSWGYGPSGAHHNRIAGNHIHDIGQGLLSDMGGIYHLGVAPGAVIRDNRVHAVKSFDYGGWGLYLDEGSTGVLLEGNLVYDTSRAGFHQHYGKENVLRGNVFAFGGEAQVMRTRSEPHLSFTFERNIVLSGGTPLLAGNWQGENYRFDRNLWWRTDGKTPDFAGLTLDAWRAKGQDLRSIVADPAFIDAAKGDFRLKPGSPALSFGFKAMDPRFGLPRAKWNRKSLPPAFPLGDNAR